MELKEAVGDRNRLARVVLAVVLGAVALRSFRNRKRLRGALAGAAAVGLGYSLTAGSGEMTPDLGFESVPGIGSETTTEDGRLRCSVCGGPIEPGQRRKPDESGDTAHETCLEATA